MCPDIAMIERALDRNDLETAAALAEAALNGGERDPLIFNLVAWKAETTGRLDEAETILRQAIVQYPNDASLFLALGITLRTQGRLREGADALDTALELDNAYTSAWLERGVTFEKGGALDDAIADYRQAVSIEPTNATALALLASVLARQGEIADAQYHADLALSCDPTNLQAMHAVAMIALQNRQYEEVIRLLSPVEAAPDDRSEVMIAACTVLGDAYNGVGRFADAYRVYERAQTVFAAVHKAREGRFTPEPQTVIDRIAISFARSDKTRWTGVSEPRAPTADHIFLTGYPRSGTTLVENILATLPSVTAIEERPTLTDVDPAFLTDPDGLDRFSALSEPMLDNLRASYWERVERAAEESVVGRVFVDMDPFKGARLPIIARMFPQAKIILMRRDPRDVVWSCFHTNFAYNSGTAVFTTLERTARHYARTWEVIDSVTNSLPINVFNLRYEELVQDFDRVTRKLCDYLNITWDEKLRDFYRTARRRGVSTASVGQVRKGLYDGSGAWRRYAAQMATVEPILAASIERFESGM